MTETPPPSSALLDRIASISPVRTRRPRLIFAVVAALSLAYGTGAILLGNGLRPDLPGLPLAKWLGLAILFAVWLIVQLAWSVLPRRGQVLPRSDRASALATLLSVGFAALGAMVGFDDPERSVYPLPGELWQHALPCALTGLLLALGPALITLIALKGQLPVGAWRLGVAVGGASGALAGLALHLQCAVVGPLHVGLVHGAMVVLPPLLVGLVGSRVIST